MFLSRCILILVLALFAHSLVAAADTTKQGGDGAPMILIPAGLFPMGVPPGDRDGGRDEYPRHQVYLDDYYIDQYEVTNVGIWSSSRLRIIVCHRILKIRRAISGKGPPS